RREDAQERADGLVREGGLQDDRADPVRGELDLELDRPLAPAAVEADRPAVHEDGVLLHPQLDLALELDDRARRAGELLDRAVEDAVRDLERAEEAEDAMEVGEELGPRELVRSLTHGASLPRRPARPPWRGGAGRTPRRPP